MEDVFTKKQLELLGKDVSKYVEVKQKLTYLSWASAWQEFIKIFPASTYDIIMNEQTGLPYFGTPAMGYIVRTWVEVEGVKRFMWLPVLDMKFKVLKDEPYEYVTKYGKNKVGVINMFDVNKALMRCLTKNLAMFGLGLYIYKGEDLPEETEKVNKDTQKTRTDVHKVEKMEIKKPKELNFEKSTITNKQKARLQILIKETNSDKEKLYRLFGVKSSLELSEWEADDMTKALLKKKKKMGV